MKTKLKNWCAEVSLNNLICYLTIIIFVSCMLIGSIAGRFESVLALAGLTIGIFSTPFFTKDVEVLKYKEQLAYDKKYDELKKYYIVLSRFYVKSLRIKKMAENTYKNKLSFSELSEERKEYLQFVENNYDELVELCSLGQLEQSLYMAPTNIAFLGGINDFKKNVENLKNPVTRDMIDDLCYNYKFISEAKTGAYIDIRKCLFLDSKEDAKCIKTDRYEELCSELSPEEIRKSREKRS